MEKGFINVAHPKLGQIIQQANFPAYGTADLNVGTITGIVRSADRKCSYHGTTFLNPKDHSQWTIVFERVPDGNNYILEVYGTNACDVPRVRFDVKDPHAWILGTLSPTGGETVCNSFTAYGGSNLINPVSGTIYDNAVPPNTYYGTTISGPPPAGSWYIQFNNVPNGTNYTLSVTDTAGTGPCNTAVIVNSSACS